MAPQRNKKKQQQRRPRRQGLNLRRFAAPAIRSAKKYSQPRKLAIGPMTAQQAMSMSAKKYAAALLHPFSQLAEGATYPEPYAASTTTRKVRFELGVQPTATGNFDLAIQPHLVYSAFSGNGTITGAPVTWNVLNQPAGCNYFGSMNGTTLSSAYKSYRIVGMGARIKSNVDFTKSGGRIYVAVMPASQQLPSSLSSTATADHFYDAFDVPHDALAGGAGRIISSTIVGLPRGHQLAVSELMAEAGVEVTFPIVSAAATNFLEGINEIYEQGLVTVNPATGLVTNRASIGWSSAAGHSQLLIRGVGINTDASSAIVVEVVYHVEGIPNPVAGGSTMVESVRKLPPAAPHEISAILHTAGTVPAVQYVSEKVRAAAGGWAARAKGALASRAGQEAEKILGVAFKAGLALA